MSRNFGFAALVGMAIGGMTLGGASLAHALPLTVDPSSNWSLDTALRPSFSPLDLGGRINWTGIHVGVNAGAAFDSDFASDKSIAFIGGAQGGFDYQLPMGLVTGVEADVQGLTTPRSPWQANTYFVSQVDFLGSVRGRLGYQVAPGVLTYATAGYAYGHAVFDGSFLGGLAATSYGANREGWVVGGGVEVPLFPNFTGRIEYLRFDLGAADWLGVGTRMRSNVVRAGVNYWFNGDTSLPVTPVVAKY